MVEGTAGLSERSAQHPAYGLVREVTPFASVVLAHNPSPMTLEGTNTWIVRAPGASNAVVVDPGPDDIEHLRLVAESVPVELVLVTHGHPDHVAGVERFAELTGAPVRAFDPEWCVGGQPLREGEIVRGAGVELRVLTTPGHTSDSVCLLLEHPGGGAVLTGDTILGRGTTVVAAPDGHLGSYLDSLRRLEDLAEGIPALPGHGPELPDVRAAASAYLTHRGQRLDQVRRVVSERGGGVSSWEVVEIVYADVDRSVWPAAESTVRAQLTYLAELGEL